MKTTAYINTQLIECSFKRLSPRKSTGKTALERTSALMYFLAFDATVKKNGHSILDMEPKSFQGKNNRNDMELEFVRLVQLKTTENGTTRQVSVLGKIETSDKSPEKRISSNFFTVPLKKASRSSEAFLYPGRPPAPVLKMGNTATGLVWGIGYNEGWQDNLPQLLSEAKSNTPFTDLAIFVLRDSTLQPDSDFRAALVEGLKNRFTPEFSSFWAKRLDAEKIFAKHIDNPYQNCPPSAFADADPPPTQSQSSVSDILLTFSPEELIDRITYLEKLLDSNGIEYQTALSKGAAAL